MLKNDRISEILAKNFCYEITRYPKTMLRNNELSIINLFRLLGDLLLTFIIFFSRKVKICRKLIKSLYLDEDSTAQM